MEQTNRELYWRNVIEAFIQSGMKPTEFCASRALPIKTFYKWRKRLGQALPHKNDEPKQLRLVPIDLKAASAPIQQECDLSSGVRLGIAGLDIDLDRGFDMNTLERVLELLKGGALC